MKKLINTLNATPYKRFILSIIPDYDLTRSICELIDNAIDIWIRGGRKSHLSITIDFDPTQGTIFILDNAGGVQEKDLEFLISPGATTNKPEDYTIGIFGVGTKRAVIALAQDVKIKTRYNKQKTFLIEFDQTWLNDEEWSLDYYEIDNINDNSTVIELQKLRISIDEYEQNKLKENLSTIYGKFLENQKINIKINTQPIQSVNYENWAFPPSYEPRHYSGAINTQEGRRVEIEVLAGLIQESSPTAGEYGVYFYCNDRLIISGLKSPEVGFIKGVAGLPDASLSIVRIIVSFKGSAIDMPWNSSKSNIDVNHHIFKAFRYWLLDIVKNYCSLSRRLKGDWQENVFKYDEGEIKKILVPDFKATNKAYLLDLPPVNVRYIDSIKIKNAAVEKLKPWTIGLYEGIVAVDHISKQKLETKNRISLILLDSTLEIAIKEFLVNDVNVSGVHYTDKQLLDIFSKRHLVEKEIKKYISKKEIKDEEWKKLMHYYDLRCKLVHERATVNITTNQLRDQRKLVEKVLKKLFKLKF
jgi:hypothetical protein